MRKAQKKQAEDFVELMGQAHDEIKRAVEKGNLAAALNLLTDCQDGAVSLGNLIERTEGEDCAAILVLEEYCEQVYRVYERLVREDGSGEAATQTANAERIYRNLRRLHIKVNNSLKNDIRVRLEAVFLPYKASMWDSLESVWRAADEDPDCDAYVVPIPYYDRKPDGGLGEMHYEGNQYPDYVPVIEYGDYDFEQRMPDMVFIHNPYDNYNYVTSVPPYFYSRNLKRFTEQLIYIPYFILDEIDPENEEAVEGMKHFCLTPGVLNADKVIVQSEDMRKIYINVLTEAAGAGNRKYWEDRIIGLGSPKLDKALGTRKEELEIPEEWMRIIQKPDGTWKKIILYNTSVSALLKYDGRMISKMRQVFRTFRENQKETALLWRPHPLIQATIESMRPQLWGSYRELVGWYRKEGWGIYDDSPELNRALALGDGYYGDPSSLTQLCRSIGMPVMIQNVEIQNAHTW